MSRPTLRDPVLALTRILTEHRYVRPPYLFDRLYRAECSCGWVSSQYFGEAHHAIHVARVINDELDLQGDLGGDDHE